jgi:hypothetical protein
VSCVPCDDVCVGAIGVCVLLLWGLAMCAILGMCETNDLLGALREILEKL